RFHDELTGSVCHAVEFGELNAAWVGAGVFNQQGMPTQVAWRGARYLRLERHVRPSINNLWRDVDRAHRVTAHLLGLRSHGIPTNSQVPWLRWCLRYSHGRGLSPGHVDCRHHWTLRRHRGRVWDRPTCR